MSESVAWIVVLKDTGVSAKKSLGDVVLGVLHSNGICENRLKTYAYSILK